MRRRRPPRSRRSITRRRAYRKRFWHAHLHRTLFPPCSRNHLFDALRRNIDARRSALEHLPQALPLRVRQCHYDKKRRTFQAVCPPEARDASDIPLAAGQRQRIKASSLHNILSGYREPFVGGAAGVIKWTWKVPRRQRRRSADRPGAPISARRRALGSFPARLDDDVKTFGQLEKGLDVLQKSVPG